MNEKDVVAFEQHGRIARLINQTKNKLVSDVEKDLEPFGVSVAQFLILFMLWSGRCDTASELCKEICYSAGTMTRVLDRLEQRRLIRRYPHPASRRAHLLNVTDEGRELFALMHKRVAVNIDRSFGKLDLADIVLLEGLLTRILAH